MHRKGSIEWSSWGGCREKTGNWCWNRIRWYRGKFTVVVYGWRC